ncbi:MAG: pilus (MSHA type) biogenesis protein MshL [Gammaproteobacteria bacterium]|nr:pilus (MSHA type) biogenesis protein MshL [Gammaproteobacteria bacterium]
MLLSLLLSACHSANIEKSVGHLQYQTVEKVRPILLKQPSKAFSTKKIKQALSQERYTLLVHQVEIKQLLFALAKDARINLDIVGNIQGKVTLKAMDQPLLVLLDRIALQVPLRYQLKQGYLLVEEDRPYFASYPIEYVNIARKSLSRVDLATQISSTGFSQQAGGGGSNNSSTQVENSSEHYFWHSLEGNIKQLLGESAEDKKSNLVLVNREAGYLMVKATEKQQRKIASYIKQMLASIKRQVLVEATVVEVTLNDAYQMGVDWSLLSSGLQGVDLVQNTIGANLNAAPFFSLALQGSSSLADLSGTLRLLQQFGDIKVISSPKIMALNNQTAVLKVVDNRVYFTVSVDTSVDKGVVTTTFETQVNTVPVGFVMNVTPYISASKQVLLNIRPTISRILGFVNDPNPALAFAGVVSRVPEIQVREMESMLTVNSGEIAIIGGLMQDKLEQERFSLPGLGELPLLGKLFSYTKEVVQKTELLIFLRPTVISSASLATELKQFQPFLAKGK